MDEIIAERLIEISEKLDALEQMNNGEIIARQQIQISGLETQLSTQSEQIEKLLALNEQLLSLEQKEKQLQDENKKLSAKLSASERLNDKLSSELENISGVYSEKLRVVRLIADSVGDIDLSAVKDAKNVVDGFKTAVLGHWLIVCGCLLFCIVTSLASAYVAYKFRDYDSLIQTVEGMDAQMRASFGALAKMLQ